MAMLYVVVTRRTLKLSRDHVAGKNAPTHTTIEAIGIEGPFTEVAAEQAALSVLATHTCHGAQVVPVTRLESYVSTVYPDSPDLHRRAEAVREHCCI